MNKLPRVTISGGFATVVVSVPTVASTTTVDLTTPHDTQTQRISYSVEYGSGKERKKAQWKREINPTGKRGRRK